MNSTRWLVGVALLVGSMALLFAGCGSKTCGAASCGNGCCDSSGNCITATSGTACGTSGQTCTSCQLGQVCTIGVCTGPSGSGGGSGTGGGNTSTGGGSGTGGGTGTGGGSGAGLIGTWTLTATPNGGSSTTTTLVIGQDSLSATGNNLSVSAIRANDTETYVDNSGGSHGTAQATQTAAAFDPGVFPFSLGGSWVVTAGNTGSQPTLTCHLHVTATEIDGDCAEPSDNYSSLNFAFTTSRSSPSTSVYGDFGGTWNQTWYDTADAGSMQVRSCVLNFGGSNVTTCVTGTHPLANITFVLNAAQTMASGTFSSGEFSAVKQ